MCYDKDEGDAAVAVRRPVKNEKGKKMTKNGLCKKLYCQKQVFYVVQKL